MMLINSNHFINDLKKLISGIPDNACEITISLKAGEAVSITIKSLAIIKECAEITSKYRLIEDSE